MGNEHDGSQHTGLSILIKRLVQTEGAINDLTGGELDAVLDPERALPALLQEAQGAIWRSERQTQEALAFAEDVIATVREPLIILDAGLRVQMANDSFYRVFRVSKEETENRLLYELGNREWDIPRLREMLENALLHDRHFDDFDVDLDFPIVGRRSMRLNARRVRNGDKTGGRLLLIIEDIHERKLAEQWVRESELRYRRLFETARDGILILDGDTGKIIDANSFIEGLTGYSQDYFLGKELWQIGLFEDIAANQRAFEKLQQEGVIRYDHLPLEGGDGRKVEVEFISNVYDVGGRRVIQCNIRDITQRRKLEREVERQTAELANAHSKKDEFLAMLSHELRNPLAPLANAVHLLSLQRDENGIQKEARVIIGRQVAHLTRLVDDLLEVSRITTGKLQIRRERVTMGGIVEAALEAARPVIYQHRHNLVLALSPSPIWLDADAVRLVQVISNLLTNAAKYTDENGTIWLTTEQEGDEAVLRVRDSGIGITPAMLPRIFDLFTQAERGLARSRGGLGIGLTLVKTLVELHGGTVEAHSAGLDQGSEFVVRLPATAQAAAGTASVPADMPIPPAPGSLRVLVVDDNADSVRMVALLLERACGYQVRTASDGDSALKAAAAFQPHAVLLDIGLPGLNGNEVAKLIRLNPVLKNVMLIASTGYGQPEDRARTREAGFDHHLVKPIDFDKIRKILAAIVVTPTPQEDVDPGTNTPKTS